MTDVKQAVVELCPLAGATNKGWKLGFLDSAAKDAQGVTVTITNASEVIHAHLTIDADGTEEAVTLATNVITLTDTTTGNVSGFVLYR